MKPKILLVYAALNHPLRANTKHLIECFRQHGDANWFYLNLAHKRAPRYVSEVDFDLVIFQTTFTQRLSRSEGYFAQMTRRAQALANLDAPKVALVQDEFWNAEKVERFINTFGIGTVFSVAPPSEWPKIYPGLDPQKVRFHRVLTGYLDEPTLEKLAKAGEGNPRAVDIVYRAAGRPTPAWGRFGYIKQILVDAVKDLAPEFGLKLDVSTDARDALYGDAWIEFLAGARYTLGAPSGASLLDRDGQITARVDAYRSSHSDATFEEIERHCFSGMDGNLHLSAIGPRHIEACATRTCQILVEGDYNGLLLPDVHYLAVKSDLSNLRQVLSQLDNEQRRETIVERAYNDVVRPLQITYRNFVSEVMCVGLDGAKQANPLTSLEERILRRMTLAERREWAIARVASSPIRKIRDVLARSPGA
ncbi:MAG: hypothetical protein JSR55_10615 [Proteobacteria bacterium]|nr:hypothetical protein [Pseudomonadota bacterium]